MKPTLTLSRLGASAAISTFAQLGILKPQQTIEEAPRQLQSIQTWSDVSEGDPLTILKRAKEFIAQRATGTVNTQNQDLPKGLLESGFNQFFSAAQANQEIANTAAVAFLNSLGQAIANQPPTPSNLRIEDIHFPTQLNDSNLLNLAQEIASRVKTLQQKGSGKLKILLDLDGTIIGKHDDITPESLKLIRTLSQIEGIEIHFVTHTGKDKTIAALLQIPEISLYGDAGGYKLNSDGTVATWYIEQKYVDAILEHRDSFSQIIDKHLQGAPRAIKKQVKILSLDVVFNDELLQDSQVRPYLEKIHAEISEYITNNRLEEFFRSNLRTDKVYWDLKVKARVSKDLPVPNIVSSDDIVIIADDDIKYGAPMQVAAFKRLGKQNTYNILVQGHYRDPGQHLDHLAVMSHAVPNVENMLLFLTYLANELENK